MLQRYIVTGAPGTGKTALVRRLQEQGWAVVDEAATDVIAREQAQGNAEPWNDGDFVTKIAALQRGDSSNLPRPGPVCSSTTGRRCVRSRSRDTCNCRPRRHWPTRSRG